MRLNRSRLETAVYTEGCDLLVGGSLVANDGCSILIVYTEPTYNARQDDNENTMSH